MESLEITRTDQSVESTQAEQPAQATLATNDTTGKTESFNEDLRLPLSIIAYIGPLVIVSYITGKQDAFVHYHTKQGSVLFGVFIVTYLLGSLMGGLMLSTFIVWQLITLIQLGILVFAIIGIVHAVQEKKKPLPIIGSWAEKLSL